MNLAEIQERYMRDPLPVRLGGLAANLARVESFSNHTEHREVVERLLNESKYFIEWTAPDADLNLQSELVELQRQLAQWQHGWQNIWSDAAKRTSVATQAGNWSKRVMEKSGLLI
ncbi:MAG: hypothetical protein WBP93_08340 [Pyrinomonadaceae bacterium]